MATFDTHANPETGGGTEPVLGHWVLDLGSGSVALSLGLRNIFCPGSRIDRIDARDFFERVSADDRVAFEAMLDRCVKLGQPVRLRHRIVDANGSVVHIVSNCDAMRLDSTGAGQIVGTMHAVASTLQSEREMAALAESDRENDNFVVLGFWDSNLVCHFVTQEFALWFDGRELMVPGAHLRAQVKSRFYEEVAPFISEVLQGKTQSIETEAPKWGQSLRQVRIAMRPHWQDGRVKGFFLSIADISKRIELERHIHELEEELLVYAYRLRRIQAFAKLAIWEFDLVANEIVWSQNLPEVMGYAANVKPSVEAFYNAIHVDDLQTVIARNLEGARTGESVDFEHRIVWNDGTVRWVRELSDVVRGADGRPLRCFGCTQDITPRKEAKIALVANHAFSCAVGHDDRRTTFILNRDSFEQWRNDATSQGRPAPDSPSAAWNREVIDVLANCPGLGELDEKALLAIAALIWQVGERKSPALHTHYVVIRDGQEFWFETCVAALEAHSRHLVVGSAEISAYRQMQRAQQTSEALVEEAFCASPIAMAVIGLDLRFVRVNQALCTLLGWEKSELLAKSVVAVKSPEFLERGRRAVSELLQGMRPHVFLETEFVHKDGRRIPADLTISVMTVGDDATRWLFAHIQDISQRKKTMSELLRAQQAAEAGNRAKSEFLAHMSHELRTPLNAMIGFSQVLEAGSWMPDCERAMSMATRITNAGWYLLSLINSVLDFANIEAKGERTVELSAIEPLGLVEACIDFVMPLVRKAGLRLSWDEAGGAFVRVRTDESYLKPVLLNLLTNAVKYNRPGGEIRVRTGVGENGHYCLSVEDTGMGLTQEQQERLFHAFDRLGAERRGIEGTGLGLALSKKMTEAVGASIHVESQMGVGSRFWLEVPLDHSGSGALVRSAEVCRILELPSVNAGRVLLIEDNELNRILVAEMIGLRPGLELFIAVDAETGVTMARSHLPDLIVMDINLPGMDGYAALRTIRSIPETADVPVVAVSASAGVRDLQKALDAGFDRYLTKPVVVEVFLKMLDSVFARALAA
jgi:PAS domain S-box-containing protein